MKFYYYSIYFANLNFFLIFIIYFIIYHLKVSNQKIISLLAWVIKSNFVLRKFLFFIQVFINFFNYLPNIFAFDLRFTKNILTIVIIDYQA